MIISPDDIGSLRIGLASPEEILSWSKGEVTESETINYRTHKPERGGLYAEEIFGPVNDYECACGKYRGRKFEGIVCEKCHVLVTDSSVRRVNMGHITLASPVVHFWFIQGISSPLSILLGIKRNILRRIIYYETEPIPQEQFIITSSGDPDLEPGELLSEMEYKILAGKKEFSAEPAYAVTHAPEVRARAGGKVSFARERLENGEEILLLRVGEEEYPLSPDAELLVEEGAEVEEGAPLATAPAKAEVLSKAKFELFERLYGVKGQRLEEEVDNLLFLVTKVKNPEIPLKVGDTVWELEKRAYELAYKGQFEAQTGALGIKGVLESLDLEQLSRELREKIAAEETESQRARLLKRLEIVEQLRKSGNRPQDIVLSVIPVLPPSLRPIVQLEGGKFATTDLNDLYRRIINRNNRLKKLMEMGAPQVILRNERRMLQEAVDALIYNEKKENPILGRDNRPLLSLSERIQGKHGRLRRNLLGRRVDYSGRAVIVVNPKLKLHQCGIPKKMALELFKPFILNKLETRLITNYDEIKNKALSGEMPQVWDILEELIKEHPVLLNRAPTLHRLGIQAFEPILVDGDAIQIHPFVCPPYNADFDGDQMAVHLPLSKEAIQEARELMLSSKNILSPARGEPLSEPTQDLIFAYYYLTLEDPNAPGKGKAFSSVREAERAYEEKVITLHTPIKVRLDGKLLETTLGRVKLNLLFPEDLRNFNMVFTGKDIERVIMECYHRHGLERTVQLLDDLKELGFKIATQSGLTISIMDALIPPEKGELLRKAEERVAKVYEDYERGLATDEERKAAVISIWRETVDRVREATMRNFAKYRFNPIYCIVRSGARGSATQVTQLAGIRGPMADPTGRIIEMPVKSNFREGLSCLEYFISTHGGRKGTADTALKTADSGYLTRRLVDVTEELIVKEEDCGTANGIEIDPLYYGRGDVMETIEERIYGRVAAQEIRYDGEVYLEKGELIGREKAAKLGRLQFTVKTSDPKFLDRVIGMKSVADIRDPKTNFVIVRQDELINDYLAERLRASGVPEVTVRPNIVIRSPMTCETRRGVCQKCYGLDLSNHKLVALGTAVGVIAAQSIGEPGTQLTMKTFHTGGIAGIDITQGLPRAEELFEARKALRSAEGKIADINGNIVGFEPTPQGTQLVRIRGEEKKITVPLPLCRAKPGDELQLGEIIARTSPSSGELRIIQRDGRKSVLIIPKEIRRYPLPEGVQVKLQDGQWVEAGTPITEPYHEGPILAQTDGVVEEIIQNGKRAIIIRDGQGQRVEHPIPRGARCQVQVGDQVKQGEKLTTRSTPIVLKAEKSGQLLLRDGEAIIYHPKEEGPELTLTPDLELLREDGAHLEKGEQFFRLRNLPEHDWVVIDRVEERDGLAEITFHYESKIELPSTSSPIVRVGDKVRRGDLLSKGVTSPHLLLKVAGVERAREYLLTEIHKVYKSQGVDINDKHIELVIRQMLNNVRIEDPGDSRFFPNQLVVLEEFNAERERLAQENRKIREAREGLLGAALAAEVRVGEELLAPAGTVLTEEVLTQLLQAGVAEVTIAREGKPETVRIKEWRLPSGERVMLRISKAALETKSFLAAASFQRTTTVLAEAALRGEVDRLEGLKPNVIVGRKIPAGTGFSKPA
jgi:DNA-directed RNA polymerase subunit beta'